jgi:high affinity Mn2+ porin
MKESFGSFILMAILTGAAAGQQGEAGWSIHGQATSIGDAHGGFPALYDGMNSMPSHPERRVSLTATAFLRRSLGRRLEVVFAPEIAGGKGFGQVTGAAGFPNGEIPRVAGAAPQLYMARAYVRYSWTGAGSKDGGDGSAAEATSIAGKFAVTDFFDNNRYSHDPRTQFMNWSLMNNGAWDYPADTRGYTIGAMQEVGVRQWWLRAAIVMEPTVANGSRLDTRLGRNRGSVVELERRFGARRGAVRVLGYRNSADSGTYAAALAAGGTPDITAVRRDGTRKYGFGVNAEYEVARNVGAFFRYGWSDGKTESWAFTEIDRSLSGGLSIAGKTWGRQKDQVGLGIARNGLAPEHRAYLAAGGFGFILGDGALRYGPETDLEAYYAFYVGAGWTVTGDYQRLVNPGYNRDRGPVPVASLRLHWER